MSAPKGDAITDGTHPIHPAQRIGGEPERGARSR